MRRSLLLLALAIALPAAGQIAEGDAQWARRGEGQTAGRARPERVDAAIAAYRRAVTLAPADLEPRWKLLRAVRFKGAYVAQTTDEKKRVYEEAKGAGGEALAQLEQLLRGRGVASIEKGSEQQVAAAARGVPGAAEVMLWDAVNWGEWALVFGKLAAVRQGAADRIRREATIAMLLDPRVEAGAPARVLGRLHDQTPRVPFLTGWASSREALRLLGESLRIDPANKLTRVFLAEAILNADAQRKGEAMRILRETLRAPDDPAYAVEDAAANENARALLTKLGG